MTNPDSGDDVDPLDDVSIDAADDTDIDIEDGLDADADTERDGVLAEFELPEFELPFGDTDDTDTERDGDGVLGGFDVSASWLPFSDSADDGETSRGVAETARDAYAAMKPHLHTAKTTLQDGWETYNSYSTGTQAKLAVGVVLVAVLVTVIAAGWLPTVSMVVSAGVLLGALAAGLLLIPGLAWLVNSATIARILWTIASLTQGGMILRHEDSGEYQTYAPHRDDDDGVYIETSDGRRVEIATPTGHWFRLGKKRFGVTYQKTREMYGDLVADLDTASDGEEMASDREAYADGGHAPAARLDIVRGGYRAFTPFTGYLFGDNGGDGAGKTQGEDGWVLRADTAAARKRGAGGRRQAGKAKEQTLKEHGGNNADLAGKWFYIAFMGSLLLGTLSGYLAGGM